MGLFPRIQFISTVHSPLAVLGMDSTFSSSGFALREMPSGRQITPESYCEFLTAFEVFSKTRRFEDQVLARVAAHPQPIVLLVEGTSDVILIEAAWNKLLPDKTIPFQVIACGVEPDPQLRNGGADTLRRCVEFLAVTSEKTIVALFDNDREGNEQFAALNKRAFDLVDDFHKKHKSGRSHAVLLPVPSGRELFVTSADTGQRYLAIEHYFSDEILQAHDKIGSKILGTCVYEIVGQKVPFAKKARDFEASEFTAFISLFDRIISVIQCQEEFSSCTALPPFPSQKNLGLC